MASRKEYEMLFQLNAQLGSSYNSTFKAAQSAVTSMQKEIQALSKTQSDISAFQKQQNALEANRSRLENLQQQYDNIQREIQETGTYSSDLANKLLAKQQQIDKTSASVDRQAQKLQEMGAALREAGVDTNNLERESARLGNQIEDLKGQQEDAAQSAEDFSETSTSAFEAVSQALVSAGIAAGLKEIADAYMECIKGAGDFEEAMSNVEALSGASGEDMAKLASMAKELGATTKFTAEEAADAMGYMAMAGWDANSMLSGMDGVLQLAAASGEDLARVSDIVTDNLTAFGLSAADTAHFSDVLAAAATSSNTSVSIMGETFKNSASVAGALGYSIEDVAVATGLMANAGVKGSRAGTALRNVFNGLLEGVTLTGAAFGEYEYSAVKADGTMESFSETIDTLRGYFEQMTEAERVNNAITIAGERGYNGLLAILNATDADYQSLAATINDCSGAAQRMANIKLDNMNGELTIMKSAWDALKMSIGEQFTPTMRDTYEVATDVLNLANKFIKQHPTLLKMVTAFVGAVGTATVALTAYAAISKVIKALDMASAFAVAGPIMLGVGAVAALTAGIVSLYKEANNGIPSVEELTEAAQELNETVDAAGKHYDDTSAEILAASNMADMYISRLEEMGDFTKLNNDEQQEYKNILTLLTQTVPELADQIDIQNGYIEGGTEALRANTAAWAENARAQAYQEQLTEVYKAQAGVLLEAEKNRVKLTDAELKAKDISEKRAKAEERIAQIRAKAQKIADEINKTDGQQIATWDMTIANLGEESAEYSKLQAEVAQYDKALRDANTSAEEIRKAIAKDEAAVKEAQGTIDNTQKAIENLTGSTNESTEASAEMARQQEESARQMEMAQDAADSYRERLESLCKAYDDAYKAAYESVTGQYKLWDDADDVEAVKARNINSALSNQAEYWREYNENLKSLSQRSEEIEGLSVLIASFADGTPDSVNAVAGMAKATDDQLRDMVSNWHELKTEQENVTSTIAELQTGYSSAISDITTELQSEMDGLNLSAEAKIAAMETLEGYLEGIDALSPEVLSAIEKIKSEVAASLSDYEYQKAEEAWNAAHGSNRGYYAEADTDYQAAANAWNYAHVYNSGYASGTDNAARGMRLVGENGPELEIFRGGETVFDAAETSAILSTDRGASVYNITLSPEYNISGSMDAEEIRQLLEEHDEELLDRVGEFLEQTEADAARRAYQ